MRTLILAWVKPELLEGVVEVAVELEYAKDERERLVQCKHKDISPTGELVLRDLKR